MYIIVPLVAWAAAQIFKVLLEIASDNRRGRLTLEDIVASGGMPSSHAAGAVALLTALGINEDISSPIFGLGFLVTVLICYDSWGVRRTAGESAVSIKLLADKANLPAARPRIMAKGHTPAEVAGGVIFGFVVGFLLTKVL